jgi:hypothetical protein
LPSYNGSPVITMQLKSKVHFEYLPCWNFQNHSYYGGTYFNNLVLFLSVIWNYWLCAYKQYHKGVL